MPRPKNYILHDLLDKNDANEIVCNNGNCNSKILNPHSANLERHLKKFHPDLYLNYAQQKCVKKIIKKNNFYTKNYIEQKFANRKQNNILKTESNARDLNRANIELAIVELFTRNGRPLQMTEDRAFKILVQPAFDALGISVNEQNINERILAFSQKFKQDITKDLKGKLLSLKIDALSRQNLGLLGINVQYIENKSIQIKTLAIKQLEPNHRSDYLTSVILEVLNEYEININQILTITTDHGGDNMLQALNVINTDIQIPLERDLKMEKVDFDLNEDIMQSIRCNFSSYSITGVLCGVHTLQLCVNDVMEHFEIKNKLDICRSVVNNCRSVLTNEQFKNPTIDCLTNWISTFNMLESLNDVRDALNTLSTEIPSLYLSPDIWNFVQEFLETFNPIYRATIKLQSEQLCFSELYIIIMDILFLVEGLRSSEMTMLLVNSLNKQKAELFDNELFNAAIYLDPRIKICLNNEQKERAKSYITGLYNQLNSLKEITNEAIDCPRVKYEHQEEPSASSNYTLAKSFSEFLENLDHDKPDPNSALCSPLEADFIIYERQLRLPLESNIIDYWSGQNNTLSDIADIILAIPLTQTSMERLFQALKYILSDQYNRITVLNAEHLLLVNFNGIFNYKD